MSAPDKPSPHTIDEAALRSKLLAVPAIVVEKVLLLYAILSDRFTPMWVHALVVAALIYLLDPLDCVPDFLPGIGFTDDLAVLALTLERLSLFVTPRVRMCAKRLAPRWMKSGDDDTNRNQQPQTY